MSNSVRPSRFNRPQSPYAKEYIEAIGQGGAGFGQAAQDFAKQFSAIKETEAKAMAMIPDADFTGDSGPNSAFASDANKLMQKIQGGVEGSYNFANPAEVERFNMDVAALKKEMNEFEPIYNQAVANLQELSLEHDLFVKVGEDPRQAASKEVNGRAFYNKKASTKVFDEVVRMADALRYGEVITDASGKVTVTDQNGQAIADYPSRQDYLKAIVELGKPDFQPVPIIDGLVFAKENQWATQFDTESKAESAALSYVLNNPEVANRRAREVMGVKELHQSEMSEEAKSMLAKHPQSSARFDNLSDAQLAYMKEIMQGWRDLKRTEEVTKPTATQAAKAQEKRRKKEAAMQSIRVVGDEIQNAVRSGGLFEAVVGSGNMEPGTTAPGEKVTFPYSFNDSIQVTDDDGNELDLKVTQFSYDVFSDQIQLIGTTSKSSSPGQAETIVDKRVTIDGSNIDQIAKLDQLLQTEYDGLKLAELFRKFTSGEYQKAPEFQGRTTQEEVDAAMGKEEESKPEGTGLADGL